MLDAGQRRNCSYDGKRYYDASERYTQVPSALSDRRRFTGVVPFRSDNCVALIQASIYSSGHSLGRGCVVSQSSPRHAKRWILTKGNIFSQTWRVALRAILLSCVLQVGAVRASELLDALAANDLNSKGKLTLIDVRTADERAVFGVPKKSIWIEWKGVEHSNAFVASLKAAQPDLSGPVAFICSVGHRSGQAARLAEREGYRKVFDVAEGVNGSTIGPGWRLWGLPLEVSR